MVNLTEFAPKWTGRASSRRCSLQRFIKAPPSKAPPSRLLLLQQIGSKIARVGCSLHQPDRYRRIDLAGPARIRQFRLIYQVEIRHHQIPSLKVPYQLTGSDARDSTRRLRQLRGCYVEIAAFPAAFG